MKRSVLAVVAGLALASTLSGCVSLLPKTKPSQLYRFGAEGSRQLESASGQGAAVEGPSGAQKTGVVLAQIGFPRASTSDGILTVTGDQTAYIAGARWVAPARILFQEAVEHAFERDGKAVQIVQIGDVGPAGAVLRIDVTAFEVRYRRQGPSPVAVIALLARLTRADGRILDQREFSTLEPVASNNVSVIVRALDTATSRILTDVVSWTDQQASRASATPPPPQPVATTTTTTTSTTSSQSASQPQR
jgi:cholesterol transport system auxiliary component